MLLPLARRIREHVMGFLDWFRKPPPIRDAGGVSEFIDRNAAFLMQKALYEYSRAPPGHYSKVLFREPTFQAAVEVSRWRAIRSVSRWWLRWLKACCARISENGMPRSKRSPR